MACQRDPDSLLDMSFGALAPGRCPDVAGEGEGDRVMSTIVARVSGLVVVCILAGTSSAIASEWVTWPVNGHQYKAVSVPSGITWSAARDAAITEGGYLATIANADENSFAFSLVADPLYWNFADYTMGPWLGGFQPEGAPEPSGGWSWVTGEPFTYANWVPGEPNDNPNEDWLHFAGGWGGPMSDMWNDATDNGTGRAIRGYVVERIPEPGAGAIVLLGALAFVRRRRSDR